MSPGPDLPPEAGHETPVEARLALASPTPGGEGHPTHVGDRVPVTLTLTGPARYQIGTPEPVSPGPDWTLQPRGSPVTTAGTGEGQTIEIPLFLIPFHPGAAEFPGVVATWTGPDGSTGEARSGPLPLTVVPLLAGAAAEQPADIRGPAELTGTIAPLWLPALAVLLAAIAAAWWWRRRRHKALFGLAPPPADPFEGLAPDVWALRAIESLIADDLAVRKGMLLFHIRLADILRRYLEGRYGVEAPERTTTEILREVERRDLPSAETRVRLRRVLEQCDLVKFARALPVPPEAIALAREAGSFIEETRAVPALRESA